MANTAKEIMTKEVIVVNEDMKIINLIELLSEKRISGAPVVNKDNKLVGIVTKSDLLGSFIDYDIDVNISFSLRDVLGFEDAEKPPEKVLVHEFQVKEIMSTNLITATGDTPIEKLAEMMIDSGIHRIIIVDQDRISGIVSTYDMLYHLCGEKKNG